MSMTDTKEARTKLHTSISTATQERLEKLGLLWELPLGRVVDRLAREQVSALSTSIIETERACVQQA